jgi:hypothetical protein
VREILHDAPHIALVHVGKEALVHSVVGRIFKDRASGAREGLNVAVSVERQDRTVWKHLFLEALPTLIEERRAGRIGQSKSRPHEHETGLVMRNELS